MIEMTEFGSYKFELCTTSEEEVVQKARAACAKYVLTMEQIGPFVTFGLDPTGAGDLNSREIMIALNTVQQTYDAMMKRKKKGEDGKK